MSLGTVFDVEDDVNDDEAMEEEEYGVTDDGIDIEMDINDTIPNHNHNLSFEEWVVGNPVVYMFNSGAINNLKVGLVNPTNFEDVTWYIKRWIASNIITDNTKRDNLNSSHMVMCDCISNSNNNINISGPKNTNTLPELSSPGKSNQW